MSPPLRIAFQALAANKLRSALTMLGNVIGVMCVVALVNIGISGREKIQNSLSSIGQNVIFIFPRYDAEAENPAQRWRPLAIEDVKAITENCPSLAAVSPETQTMVKAVYGNQHISTVVEGVQPSFLTIRDWKVSSGQPFTEADVRGDAKVCLVGRTIVRELFGSLDPVGQSIRLNHQPYQVVGVLEEKGTFLTGDDQDKIILAPFTAVQGGLIGGRWIHLIFASARERDGIEKAKEEIKAAIRQSHKLPPNRKDDIDTQDMGQMAQMVDTVLMSATALLASIAFISLLVGGIGIMNIMLVSVTERTREVGLRMAVGATDLAILMQFLVEAVVLSAIGGAFGALLGLGLSIIVSLIFHFPTMVSGLSVVVALAFSAAVGIFFGLYPAWRASKLDPIVALRHE
jgi:putative ABC transport system permease protein